MRIVVNFSPGQWAVDPNPARVRVGEPIEWILRSHNRQLPELLVWTVYFNRTSPFGLVISRFTVTTVGSASADHLVFVGPVYAAVPGDHKYGVRVQDAISQRIEADDDPVLIVIP